MSIQRYLLIVILSVVTLATFGAALQGYKASKSKLNQVFDEEMRSFASALLVSSIANTPITNSPIANSTKTIVLHSAFAYQIWINHELRIKSDNAPDTLMTKADYGFRDASFLGQRWRIFVLSEDDSQVMVAQPIKQRFDSIEQVLLEAILPIVYTIPIIGLLVFLAIKRSLKPLNYLSNQLKKKGAKDLAPIEVIENTEELKPIEQTLNRLFERLDDAFEREKSLSSDAAHELRTPISVLKLTTHNLMIAYADNRIEQKHIDELNQNTIRMAHVIEQIIALNRTSHENFEHNMTHLDLRKLLQHVISENYEKIEQNHQTIVLKAKPVMLSGDRFSLNILFDNLIKNANKYSGQNTDIIVSINEQLDHIEVIIEDSGIGIAQASFEKVFNRFYREKQHVETGSGLGLSIVKHIVDLHKGHIRLMTSPLGGLKVVIQLIKNHGQDTIDE
jgi:two-component system, OmpR family, sensor histidine kinase QseC